jgi:hypothetical protein
MLFVNNFEYDGINSKKYGLFFGHVDTERLKQICGNLEYNQVFYPSLNRQEIHGVNKDEFPLSFDLEIISAEPISYWSAKEIKKWLFNLPTYKKLYASRVKDKTIEKINGEEKRRYVECIFTNPEAMFYADGLHGWKCTCILSSGWAFQDEIEITHGFDDPTIETEIIIPVDSDNNDYIYPSFSMVTDNSSAKMNIQLKNKSNNSRVMEIEGVPANTVISVLSDIGTIKDDTEQSLYGFLKDQKFLRLVNGDNIISVKGITSLTIRYQNVRYII